MRIENDEKEKVVSGISGGVMVLGLMGGMAVATDLPPNWDITGTWEGWSYLEAYEFDLMVDSQDDDGNFTGTMEYPGLGISATISGSVSGNNVTFTREDEGSTYWATLSGTITSTSMSGTFIDINNVTGDWEAFGSATLIYEARVTGGGQILAESGIEDRHGRDINYRISFGGGAYIVNGELWIEGLEVTFHHVSVDEVVKGKFVAESLTEVNFFGDVTLANYTVLGTFNGDPGYKMVVRAQDSGEPGGEDNIRFELWDNGSLVYDSFLSGDFCF